MKNHMLRLPAGKVGIQRLRLAAITRQQNPGAVRHLDTRGPVRTHMMKPRNAAHAGGENEDTDNPCLLYTSRCV